MGGAVRSRPFPCQAPHPTQTTKRTSTRESSSESLILTCSDARPWSTGKSFTLPTFDPETGRANGHISAHESAAACRRAVPQVAKWANQFLRNKRAEWEDYRRQVTEYERRRYIAVL